jgi:hypothetical protein
VLLRPTDQNSGRLKMLNQFVPKSGIYFYLKTDFHSGLALLTASTKNAIRCYDFIDGFNVYVP